MLAWRVAERQMGEAWVRAGEGMVRRCSSAAWPPLPEEEEAKNALKQGRLSVARDAAERVASVTEQLSSSLPGGDAHPLLEGRLLPLVVEVSRRVPSMAPQARETMKRLIAARVTAGAEEESIIRLRQELFTLHLINCDSSSAVEQCESIANATGEEGQFRSSLCTSRLAHVLGHGKSSLTESDTSDALPHLQVEGLCELAAGEAQSGDFLSAAEKYESALEIYRRDVKANAAADQSKRESEAKTEADVKVTATFDAKSSEKSEKLKRRMDRVEQHIGLCVADVLLRVSDYPEVSGRANDILTGALNWTEEDNSEEFPLALSLMAESLSRQGNNTYALSLHSKAISSAHSATAVHYADVLFTAMLQHRTYNAYDTLMTKLKKANRSSRLSWPEPLLPRDALPGDAFTPPPAVAWLAPLPPKAN